MEFVDIGFDDDWFMDEDGGNETLDEDLVQENQDNAGDDEDVVLIHNLDDEHAEPEIKMEMEAKMEMKIKMMIIGLSALIAVRP